MDCFETGAIFSIVGSLAVLLHAADHLSRLLFAVLLSVTLVMGCRTVICSPNGTISPFRPYVAIIMPIYYASWVLVFGFARPLCCIVVALLAIEAKIGLCMSVCLHRYAAHAAFKCGGLTSLALGWVGCMANQGGPLWWASKHRAHHKFCDGPCDPHSALHEGEVLAFMFHGMKKHKAVDEEFVPAHIDSPAARWLDALSALPVITEAALLFWLFGADGLWVSYVSANACQIITLWFNVENHPPSGAGDCKATDAPSSTRAPGALFEVLRCTSVFAVFVGESSHSHHHLHPQLAHRPGPDLPYHLLVRPLAALGLVWDVKASAYQRSHAD